MFKSKLLYVFVIAFLFASVQLFAGQCAATTKKGSQCKRQAAAGSSYCWQHGGKSEPSNPTSQTKSEIKSDTPKKEIAPKQDYVSTQCQATTKKGSQCKRKAKAGSKYCWQHGG